MKIAVLSLTKSGGITSDKIAAVVLANHTCVQYAFKKYPIKNAVIFDDLSKLISDIFNLYDAIIFISACGIAVRMIAPYITSKIEDPAVIAVDEQGKFAISLLSGHLGGANALTELIAGGIDAVPVITTATDIGGKFSPDSFAKANNLYICDMKLAKDIAVSFINNENVGFKSNYPCKNYPDTVFSNDNCLSGICISNEINEKPFSQTLLLMPVNIVIGVGCKKNTPSSVFENYILNVLNKNNIPIQRVCQIGTIDMKKDEKAIIDFCSKFDIPLKTYSSEKLMKVGGDFSYSDFVMQTTGTDNVCERSAVADGGKLIVRKQADNGVTFAAAEKGIIVDFERRIT